MFCGQCGAANPDNHAFCAKCGRPLPPGSDADPLDAQATVVGLRTGQLLANRYRLDRLLGRGGMGQVWLARDTELDRVVAVKVVHDLLAHDAQAMARLREEARITIPLRHPHIVAVNHFEPSGPVTFLVMEYVEGESLAERLAREKTLLAAEAIRIGLAVAQALAHAHEQRVLHRDVKPANVLLGTQGDVRLADFGIARVASDSLSRLSGALSEWVADWYGSYGGRSLTDPVGPVFGQSRVLRGGSWTSVPRFLRVSFRGQNAPDYRGRGIGVRCARDVSP